MIRAAITLAIIVIASALASSPASADYFWHTYTTDQGCLIRKNDEKGISDEGKGAFAYSWSGPCVKGQLANGNGTVSMRHRLGEGAWAGNSQEHLTGKLIDGVFDGRVHQHWTGGHERYPDDTLTYVMGCEPGDIKNGCVPRERTARAASTSSQSRGAVVPALRQTAIRPNAPSEGANPAMFPIQPVTACAEYQLLPEQAGYKYFQMRNKCNYGIQIYVKVQEDDRWTMYADMRGEIGPLGTLKSRGVFKSMRMQTTLMAVCPSRKTAQVRLQKKLTGVYTRNGPRWGCWGILENTGVGIAG